MNEDKWKDTVAHIKDNFEVLEITQEELSEGDGRGKVEIVEFQGPVGRIRLEYITQPLVLDKKTIGSRRIGSDVTIEYKYSDTETINRLKVYKYNDANDDWEEMKVERPDEMFF